MSQQIFAKMASRPIFFVILFNFLNLPLQLSSNSTPQITIDSSTESSFSTFTSIVRQRNAKISTILSIWMGQKLQNDSANFTELIIRSSNRIAFINSSVNSARVYGFDGIDLIMPNSTTNMTDFGALFTEFRAAVASKSRNSGKSPLILVMSGNRVPSLDSVRYPIESMMMNLDWVHIMSFDYYVPTRDNVTAPHAALYDPSGRANTDEGIKEWLKEGFSASRLVLGLPFHGYAWTVANSDDDGVVYRFVNGLNSVSYIDFLELLDSIRPGRGGIETAARRSTRGDCAGGEEG